MIMATAKYSPPKAGLTSQYLLSINPQKIGKGIERRDTTEHSLFIRVSPKGTFVWYHDFVKGGRRYKKTFATWSPECERKGDMTLYEARSYVAIFKQKVEDGVVEPEEKRRRVLKIEDAVKEYLPTIAGNARYTDQKARLENWVVPAWRGRNIESITNNDVVKLRQAVEKNAKRRGHSGIVMANKVLQEVRYLYNWVNGTKSTAKTPAFIKRRVEDPVHDTDLVKEVRHRSILTYDQIRRIWPVLHEYRYPIGDFFMITLLTGKRRGEIRRMRWDLIDLERRIWTLLEGETKTGAGDVIPLSDQVVSILENMPRFQSPWVFPKMTNLEEYRDFNGHVNRTIKERSGTSGWSLQSMRRTMRSHTGELGVDRVTAERLLNHAQPTLDQAYDHFDYMLPKRLALQAWADLVDRIVAEPDGENVLPIKDQVTA